MNEDIPLLICKHLIGTITPDEQRRLDEWRQRSPHNETVYQRLHDTQRLQIEHHRAQLTDHRRPLSDMKRRLGIAPRRPQWTPWLPAAAAAAILAIIIAGLCWQRPAPEAPAQQQSLAQIVPGTTQATLTLSSGETIQLNAHTPLPPISSRHSYQEQNHRQPPQQQLATPRGGEFRVVLEDGTEVWLNADTRLRYPEAFSGQTERRVEVEGEAYFKVAHDASRPFIVSSGGQEARVRGTEFNVHAYPDETDVYTTLVEGSVALSLANDSSGRELTLTPEHQATFHTASSTFRVKAVDTDAVTSWRSGAFVFEEQTLEQIMRTLSRWYDFDYEFADRHTASTVFMGSIPRYGSFADVCRVFRHLGGIRLRQDGRKVTVYAE